MNGKCVYCGTSDSLNTQMTIILDDGTKAAVEICDEHAEDASVRTAKAKYMEKKAEIDAFLAKAKELGLDVHINEGKPNGIAVAEVKQQPAVPPLLPPLEQPVTIQQFDDDMVDTEMIDKRGRPIISQGGSVGGHAIKGHNSYDLGQTKELLPEEALKGKAKIEIVEGRTGRPIALPTKRVDGMGTTTVKIVKTSDAELQRRAKNVARDTIEDRHGGYGPHGGYDETRLCPLCRGKQTVNQGKKEITCPKCAGNGEIFV